MQRTRVSGRRVALVVAVLAAALFVAGLAIDVSRTSRYRHFYVVNDASAVALFCVAAVYLRWGRQLTSRWYGRLAGRVVQAYALLACLSQALVWVRVADRGHVWWALVFLVPTLMAAGMAIASVHVAMRDRRAETPAADLSVDSVPAADLSVDSVPAAGTAADTADDPVADS